MKLFRLGSKNFFRFFSGTFFERKKAIERAEINVDQLSGFMMPSGIISGSALDYLEGENPSEKSYDEIVQIIEQNVTRTTIQSIAMAKRNLFDLLKREIRSVFRLFWRDLHFSQVARRNHSTPKKLGGSVPAGVWATAWSVEDQEKCRADGVKILLKSIPIPSW